MKTKTVFTAMFFLSSVAFACGAALPLPIPPVPVKLSWTNLASAAAKGYRANTGYAAAMMKLDSLGEKAVGADKWHSNSFAGYFTYTVSGGANTMYVEKGCNQDFIDSAAQSNGPKGGGGGGSGGMGGVGGGCGGSGSASYGIVGWTQSTQKWTVCTSGNCTSGLYTEFTPIYGTINGRGATSC